MKETNSSVYKYLGYLAIIACITYWFPDKVDVLRHAVYKASSKYTKGVHLTFKHEKTKELCDLKVQSDFLAGTLNTQSLGRGLIDLFPLWQITRSVFSDRYWQVVDWEIIFAISQEKTHWLESIW